MKNRQCNKTSLSSRPHLAAIAAREKLPQVNIGQRLRLYINGCVANGILASLLIIVPLSSAADPKAPRFADQAARTAVLAVPEGKDERIAKAARNPTRFSIPIPWRVTLADGSWTEASGISTWRYDISVPNAVSVSFYAPMIALPPKAHLVLIAGQQSVEANYSDYKNGFLLSDILQGSDMTVKIQVPTSEVSQVAFQIKEVQMGFRSLVGPAEYPAYSKARNETIAAQAGSGNGGTPPPSSSSPSNEACYRNFSCYKDSDNTDIGDSTVSLNIANGTVCTGSLVIDATRSFKTYILTARHCSEDAAPDMRNIVKMNWKAEAACGDAKYYEAAGGATTMKTSGVVERMRWGDHVLYEAIDPPPAGSNPFYLGFDAGETGKTCADNPSSGLRECSIAASNKLHYIHHGQNMPRSDAFADGSPSTAAVGLYPKDNKLTWYTQHFWDRTGGVTAGASGTSLVFNKRTIGVLSAGHYPDQSCSASYTGEASAFADQLKAAWVGGGTPATSVKAWLDPQNTGVLVADGARRPPELEPKPSVQTTLDPSTVQRNERSTLTIRSINAKQCTVDQAGTGEGPKAAPLNGTYQVRTALEPGDYELVTECSDGNIKATSRNTLTITGAASTTPTTAPAPTNPPTASPSPTPAPQPSPTTTPAPTPSTTSPAAAGPATQSGTSGGGAFGGLPLLLLGFALLIRHGARKTRSAQRPRPSHIALAKSGAAA